tara:strand:+ start:1268 stop:1783 length:516 start_codon:yes stop_codon:yes gene_type:complete
MNKNNNSISTLARDKSGDFGLLPIEIWEIIYDMKNRMEWKETKKKVDNRWDDWKFHKDYHILNTKHELMDDIKSIHSGISIENYFLHAYPSYTPLPSAFVMDMDMENREEYEIARHYNRKSKIHIIERVKNGFVSIPFRFTNGVCVIKTRKWEHQKYIEYEKHREEMERFL